MTNDIECPQCQSTKIDQETVIDMATCEYCTNEFYPQGLDALEAFFIDKTQVTVPQRKNPLTIKEIERNCPNLILHLDGQQDGEYRLRIREDGTATLRRRKGASERNQFGTRWTDVKGDAWPEDAT